MTPEMLNAIASMGTFVVLGTAALAALAQLRHMSAGNQLEALLSVENDFRSPDLQESLRYIQLELDHKLQEPAYRAALEARGYLNTHEHPELIACNWFNKIGALLKSGLILESTFMDIFSRLIIYYWERLSPVVAIMRRKRGSIQYNDFEYLAIRATTWLSLHPHGTFPKDVVRPPLEDPWQGR